MQSHGGVTIHCWIINMSQWEWNGKVPSTEE